VSEFFLSAEYFNLELSMGFPKLAYLSAVRHYHPKLSLVKSGNRDFSFIGKEVAGAYVYGFNGMEKDDEVKGSGNSYNYKKRIYDSKLGRFLSIDNLTSVYPWYTPYQFAGNTPIWAIDVDGLEELIYTESFLNAGGKIIMDAISEHVVLKKYLRQASNADKNKTKVHFISQEVEYDDDYEHRAETVNVTDQVKMYDNAKLALDNANIKITDAKKDLQEAKDSGLSSSYIETFELMLEMEENNENIAIYKATMEVIDDNLGRVGQTVESARTLIKGTDEVFIINIQPKVLGAGSDFNSETIYEGLSSAIETGVHELTLHVYYKIANGIERGMAQHFVGWGYHADGSGDDNAEKKAIRENVSPSTANNPKSDMAIIKGAAKGAARITIQNHNKPKEK
jgi:RHS repeat-associated protein